MPHKIRTNFSASRVCPCVACAQLPYAPLTGTFPNEVAPTLSLPWALGGGLGLLDPHPNAHQNGAVGGLVCGLPTP